MGRFLGLLLCAFLLVTFTLGFATETDVLPLGAQDLSRSEANLNVSRVSPEWTSISLESPTVLTQDQVVDYQTYQAFGITGEDFLYHQGSPTVPQVSRYYQIPNTGGVELQITDAEYDVVDNINAYPIQPDDPGFHPLVRNESLYSRDGWYPANVAVMSDPMIMRDFRVVSVMLYPVQVNPVTHQARIYRRLNVNVVANSQPGVNELLNPHRPSREWANMYRHNIANLDDNALDDVTTTPGSILILTSTNSVPRPWADSLFVWKTRQGFRVTVDARATWSSAQAITDIRTAYAAAPADAPLEFVILMGDPAATWGIPTDGSGWNSANFDHSYALANTGDDIEDIGVGRLSGGDANTLATINAKIMGYERTPHLESSPGVADTMWFHKAFLYAGTARGCADNALLMRWGRQQFLNNTAVNNVDLATHGSDQIVESDVTTRLNAGVSFFIWRGSWIGGMPSSTPNNCNSGWRLPVCMTVTCDAGDFATSVGVDGPAEGFLCDGTASNPKGAVCGIGTSTSGTENGANVILASGLLYNIADLLVEHLGTAVAGAKAQLYLSYAPGQADPEGDPRGIAGKFSRLFNLLGDPSLSMWTDVPKVLNVTHPTTLNVGARSVTVAVTRAADAVPVEDAVVCLWKRGADSTWVTGMTDAQGHITLPVSVNATGDMYLTVTKRNHKPYLYTINCGQVDAMPMASSVVLDDDNSGGTQGNGDHIMNAGETIDLPLYIRNFGNAAQVTGISTTLSSNNPDVTVTTATSTYPNLAPGDSSLGATPYRIHVAPGMQNLESVLLNLAITSSAGQTSGVIPLVCHSPAPDYVRQTLSATLDPGATVNLVVVVRNTGTVAMTGVQGHLVPLTPFVQADVGDVSFGNIPAGALDSNQANPFTLTANTMTFRGLQAPMRLILTTTDGFADTTQFIVPVGTALGTDPTGPDTYGYYAYDNTDASYEIHPTFSYVDISTSGGTLLTQASQDGGDKTNVTPIWSNVVRLPFGFRFYGQVYDSLTVCSNGWCAFGNQSWYDGFRNFRIPGMRAPDALIAPYWDDLVTTGTGHGVWVKTDSTNHRYIIQWKATAFSSSPNLDFEVILFDTLYQPTFSGNGNVLVQYNHAVMNLQPQYGDDSPGCTIGIQAPGGTVGLQYAYQNTYSPGGATVSDGRAILFTTDARMMFGDIIGQVTNAANNQPMAGVSIGVNGYAYHATTDGAGHYSIPNVLIGTYGLHASLRRFNTDSVANIVVLLDSTVTVNFTLQHPEMALSVDTLRDSIGGVPAQTSFRINNAGNGPLDFGIEVRYAGDDNPTPWDSVGNVAVTDLTGNYQAWGCEFLGDTWWVTAGGSGGPNVLYRFGRDGSLVGSVPQPSSSAFGWMDLATDGTLLYGSDSHVIYGVDMTGQVADTIPSPLNPTRAIAYDPTTQHFWIADYTSDIYEITRSGVVVNQVANTSGLTITGLAWNAVDANGFKLYIFSQDGSSQRRLTHMRPTAPFTQETVVDLPGTVGDRAGGCAITGGWNSVLLTFAGILRGASGADHLEIYEMTFNTTWISVVPSQGSVPAAGGSDIAVHFDPVTLRDGIYHVNLRIASAVYDTTMILPVELEVARGVVTAQTPETALPTQYALRQNYPNPFNPTTQIAFDLPKAGHVELQIYNSLGQLVTTLLDDARPAGMYTLAWDAHNVSAGIYFYRLKAGSFVETKKMLLIR